MTKSELVAAIKEAMEDRFTPDEYGTVLLIAATDFADPIVRPEVQAFVDGIATRLGATEE